MQNKESSPSQSRDYVLDSYALLAYLEAEPGSKRVSQLLEMAENGRCHLYMCIVNLGEVLYIVERERGLSKAPEILARIDELPIEIVDVDRTLTLTAAHFKAGCPIAYADCFAAALAKRLGAVIVTGDPEFREVEKTVKVRWV